MRLSHAIPKGKDVPVVWLDWTPEEELQLRFIAVQDGSVAAVTSAGLKGWAQSILNDHLSFPSDPPRDLENFYTSLFVLRPGSSEWLPACTELNLVKGELLVRYFVGGDSVCQAYRLGV